MQPLLYLVHRIPFPPNKGDKVRSYHLLRHLASRYEVFVGTFVDDPADWAHVAALRTLCADAYVGTIRPRLARLRSLAGWVRGEALTLPFYRSRGLAEWVEAVIARHRIRKAVIFSAAMAQYVVERSELTRVIDFVDVDSEKWRQYAQTRRGLMAYLYRREGRRLLHFERAAAALADASVFATSAEADLFKSLAPECASRATAVSNGVDAGYFAPAPGLRSPFPTAQAPIVFTGAMDYWPNIDAVQWFAAEALPQIKAHRPNACFYVIGMNPAHAVKRLAELPGVYVTGRVPDVRPFLQHAAVVVAPMRIARGVQNKVLEAMAMARPVVTTQSCAAALSAIAGKELFVAETAGEFAHQVLALLDGARHDAIGTAARARVLTDYDWGRNLNRFEMLLNPARAVGPAVAASLSALASPQARANPL